MKKSLLIGILLTGLASASDFLSLSTKDVMHTLSSPYGTTTLPRAISKEKEVLIVRRGVAATNTQPLLKPQAVKSKPDRSKSKDQTLSLSSLANDKPATVASIEQQARTLNSDGQIKVSNGSLSKKHSSLPESVASTGQQRGLRPLSVKSNSNVNTLSSRKQQFSANKQGFVYGDTLGIPPSKLLHDGKQLSSPSRNSFQPDKQTKTKSAATKVQHGRNSPVGQGNLLKGLDSSDKNFRINGAGRFMARREGQRERSRSPEQKDLSKSSSIKEKNSRMLKAENLTPQRGVWRNRSQSTNSRGLQTQLRNKSRSSGVQDAAKAKERSLATKGKGTAGKKLCKRMSGHPECDDLPNDSDPNRNQSNRPLLQVQPNLPHYFAAPEFQEMTRRHKAEEDQEQDKQDALTNYNLMLNTAAAGTGPSAGLVVVCCAHHTAIACAGFTCPQIAAMALGGSAIGLAAGAAAANWRKKVHDQKRRENAAKRAEEVKRYYDSHVSAVGSAVVDMGAAVNQMQTQVGGIQNDLQNVVGRVGANLAPDQELQVLRTTQTQTTTGSRELK